MAITTIGGIPRRKPGICNSARRSPCASTPDRRSSATGVGTRVSKYRPGGSKTDVFSLKSRPLAWRGASDGVVGRVLRRLGPPCPGERYLSGAFWLLTVGIGLPLWVLVATVYTVGQTQVKVRSGPFRWRIPVKAITRITPSTQRLASPALSSARLCIDYAGHRGQRSVQISLADPDAFLPGGRRPSAMRMNFLARYAESPLGIFTASPQIPETKPMVMPHPGFSAPAEVQQTALATVRTNALFKT